MLIEFRIMIDDVSPKVECLTSYKVMRKAKFSINYYYY